MEYAEQMERIERIEDLVRFAEQQEDPRGTIDEALREMGEALIRGEPLDRVRLQRAAIRFATAMRGYPADLGKVLAGLRLSANVESFVKSGEVQLGDGRKATEKGWSFKNVSWRLR